MEIGVAQGASRADHPRAVEREATAKAPVGRPRDSWRWSCSRASEATRQSAELLTNESGQTAGASGDWAAYPSHLSTQLPRPLSRPAAVLRLHQGRRPLRCQRAGARSAIGNAAVGLGWPVLSPFASFWVRRSTRLRATESESHRIECPVRGRETRPWGKAKSAGGSPGACRRSIAGPAWVSPSPSQPIRDFVEKGLGRRQSFMAAGPVGVGPTHRPVVIKFGDGSR